MARRARKEKALPLQLFTGHDMAAHDSPRSLRARHRLRHQFVCGASCPLQLLRPHSVEPILSRIYLGKQPSGRHCRTLRQLRFLQPRGLDPIGFGVRRCGSDICHPVRSGVEKRPHLLQHRLPRRNRIGIPLALFTAENQYRFREMQRLRPLFAPLQGSLYRRQEPHRGLLALRGLLRLCRHLHPRSHQLRPAPEISEDRFRA